MQRIAQFEKVSFEQFQKDMATITGLTDTDTIKAIYDKIQIPKRASSGSAGYDFYAPFDFENAPDRDITIPTGIRCKMDSDWVLQCYPRSSLGFKYGVRLANTVGIIDSDYYYSNNEGHIMFKLVADKTICIKAGDRFIQGIFMPYGITVGDNCTSTRNGGFGSSGK